LHHILNKLLILSNLESFVSPQHGLYLGSAKKEDFCGNRKNCIIFLSNFPHWLDICYNHIYINNNGLWTMNCISFYNSSVSQWNIKVGKDFCIVLALSCGDSSISIVDWGHPFQLVTSVFLCFLWFAASFAVRAQLSWQQKEEVYYFGTRDWFAGFFKNKRAGKRSWRSTWFAEILTSIRRAELHPFWIH
jgi:hypothetical protein